MPEQPELKMQVEDLHREKVYTDQKLGSIRELTPITPSGEKDGDRPVRYFGSAQVYTPAGALPLNFELEASSLSEACEAFGDAARTALDETMEQLKEMQRDAASSIVVPKNDPSQGMGGAGGRGGGIQMP